jgi:hypothetical protein
MGACPRDPTARVRRPRLGRDSPRLGPDRDQALRLLAALPPSSLIDRSTRLVTGLDPSDGHRAGPNPPYPAFQPSPRQCQPPRKRDGSPGVPAPTSSGRPATGSVTSPEATPSAPIAGATAAKT